MALSLHLIIGEDEYLVSAKAKEIVHALVPPEEQTFGLEVVAGQAENVDAALQALRHCEGALRTPGFLGGRKVVWLQDAGFLADNVVGRSEAVKEGVNRLAAALKAGLPPGVHLVVTALKADKRYGFFKVFKEAGEVHEFGIPDSTWAAGRQAEEHLARMLAEIGLRMRPDVAAAMLDRVGADTRQMAGEVEKLAVYLRDRKDVALADVKAIVSSARNAIAWDLADAVGTRDLGEALATMNRLLFQKESPIGLIVALESRIRELLVFREAIDRGWLKVKSGGGKTFAAWVELPPAADAAFLAVFEGKKDPRTAHYFRVGKLAEQARLFSVGQLRKCQKEVAEAHEALVSSGTPQPLVLEMLLVKMLS